jgi:hypothetical protein
LLRTTLIIDRFEYSPGPHDLSGLTFRILPSPSSLLSDPHVRHSTISKPLLRREEGSLLLVTTSTKHDYFKVGMHLYHVQPTTLQNIAEEVHRLAFRLVETVLGKEHPSTLTSMNNLAEVLRDQGKYKQVEEIHRLAFRPVEIVLGKERPSTLTSIRRCLILPHG